MTEPTPTTETPEITREQYESALISLIESSERDLAACQTSEIGLINLVSGFVQLEHFADAAKARRDLAALRVKMLDWQNAILTFKYRLQELRRQAGCGQ